MGMSDARAELSLDWSGGRPVWLYREVTEWRFGVDDFREVRRLLARRVGEMGGMKFGDGVVFDLAEPPVSG